MAIAAGRGIMDAGVIRAAIEAAQRAGCRKLMVRADGSLQFHFPTRISTQFDAERFRLSLCDLMKRKALTAAKTHFVTSELIFEAWSLSTGEVGKASARRICDVLHNAITNGVLVGIEPKRTAKQRGWIVHKAFWMTA